MIDEKKYTPYLRITLIISGVFYLLVILYFGKSIFAPFIFATLIAIMLSSIVSKLEKKLNRIIAILIVLVPTLLIAIAIGMVIISQLSHVADNMPLLMDKFRSLLDQSISWVSQRFNINHKDVTAWFTNIQNDLIKNGNVAIGYTVKTMTNILLDLVLIPVSTFFILYYRKLLLKFIYELANSHEEKVKTILSEIKNLVQRYLVGITIEASIVAILYFTGLLLIGVDYALLLGTIGALLNVIPYLGGILAALLFIIVALITKDTPSSVFFILILYIIVHATDNFYLIPRIVASKVRLNAFISIFMIFTASFFWGIPGIFLAIPVTGVMKVILDHIPSFSAWGLLLGDESPLHQ